MSYIKTIDPQDAQGSLKETYDKIQQSFGGPVPNILSVQSLRPDLLAASMESYLCLMLKEHALSRTTKELIAAHVSKINSCAY